MFIDDELYRNAFSVHFISINYHTMKGIEVTFANHMYFMGKVFPGVCGIA